MGAQERGKHALTEKERERKKEREEERKKGSTEKERGETESFKKVGERESKKLSRGTKILMRIKSNCSAKEAMHESIWHPRFESVSLPRRRPGSFSTIVQLGPGSWLKRSAK